MKLPVFLLDRWLDEKKHAGVHFDLGSSTGPEWTYGEFLQILEPDERDSIRETRLVYPPSAGDTELRRAIADSCGAEWEQVVAVTGAMEALLILFYLSAEPGANVLVPHPCFPPMAVLPESMGLEVRSYPLRPENRFQLDPADIKSRIDRHTKLLLVNSPHNPTGATLEPDLMRELHDLAAERGIRFVVDEVYHPLYLGPVGASAIGLPRATILGDLSKAMSLSGLRIGWIVEHDRTFREQFIEARSYFTISNTALGERLAILAFKHRDRILERARNSTGENLRLLEGFFEQQAGVLGWVRPTGGTTSFPWLLNGGNAREFCNAALQHKVLLVPGDCFGMPAHFRLGFGTVEDDFDRALDALSKSIKSHFGAQRATR